MARKILIQREKKKDWKKEMSDVSSLDEKLKIYRKLQSPPRKSVPTRLRQHCLKTRRPRANYRDFELSRYIIREMDHACLLAKVTKLSW